MSFTISKSNGDLVAVTDGTANNSFSIPLLGRNYSSYADEIAQAQLNMLENFSNVTAPQNPTTGQLWYDSANKVLRVWNGSSLAWKPVNVLVSDATPSNQFNQLVDDGALHFNSSNQKLFVSVDQQWEAVSFLGDVSDQFLQQAGVGNPTLYGSRLRTIFLNDSLNIKRAVLAITYVNTGDNSVGNYYNGEKIIAIFSGHNATFTVNDLNQPSITDGTTVSYQSELAETGGIGLNIVPGLNLRTDSPFTGGGGGSTDLANYATTAFNLNTGSYGTLGTTIPATNVYHRSADLVPISSGTYRLGTSAAIFLESHATNFYVGNGTTGAILPRTGSAVTIGASSLPISALYTNDISYTGGDEELLFAGTTGSVTFSAEGDIVASGIVTSSSDIKFKDNLEPITDAIEKLNQLTGYSFTRNDKDNRKEIGLVAQEVQKVFPEAVLEMNDGTLTVAYDSLLGGVVEAVKELNKHVHILETELALLRKQVKTLLDKGA
jgi:hypothetical protein